MTEEKKGLGSAGKGLVLDFKALSVKQWVGIVVAILLSLLLEIYFSNSCFGFFIVAVLLYMIPHLLGVSSVKVKAVVGVAFIVLAVPVMTTVFSGTLDAVQDNLAGQENDYISDVVYDMEDDTATFTVQPYVVENDGSWEIVFQCYRVQSMTVALNGDMNSLQEIRFDPTTLEHGDSTLGGTVTVDENGVYHVTVSGVDVPDGSLYVMGAFIVLPQNNAVENMNAIVNNNASETNLALTGAAYTVAYAAIVFFIILIFSALMRRSAEKTRAKMEAEGRLYPQGYGRCKQCGAMVLPGEVNCRKCGAYIDVPEELKPKKKDSFTCSECGAEVPGDAKMCPKCGAAFDEDDENVVVHADGTEDVSSETVVCPECGNVVPANADWCPRCGKMLK